MVLAPDGKSKTVCLFRKGNWEPKQSASLPNLGGGNGEIYAPAGWPGKNVIAATRVKNYQDKTATNQGRARGIKTQTTATKETAEGFTTLFKIFTPGETQRPASDPTCVNREVPGSRTSGPLVSLQGNSPTTEKKTEKLLITGLQDWIKISVKSR